MNTTKRSLAPVSVIGGMALAILAFSGSLKSTQGFSWLPIDLTLLSVALVLLACCVLCVRELREGRMSPIYLLPLALWALFLVPVFAAPNNQYAMEKVTALFTVTLLCALAPFTILKERSGQKAFIAGILVIGVYSTIGVLASPDSVIYEYSNRLALQGATTITTAQMVGAGAMVAFLGVFALRSKILRALSFVAASSMTLACFFIGSRGPVIALILAVLVMLFLSKTLRQSILLGLIAAVAIISGTIYLAVRRDSDGIGRILNFFSGEDMEGGSGRIPLYSLASEVVVENPLGVGWGGFTKYGTEYPHNLILEILVEGGIGITLVVVLLLVTAFFNLCKKSHSMIVTVLLGLYCFAVANAMFSSDITGNKLMWITLFAAFVIARRHSGSDETKFLDAPKNSRGILDSEVQENTTYVRDTRQISKSSNTDISRRKRWSNANNP